MCDTTTQLITAAMLVNETGSDGNSTTSCGIAADNTSSKHAQGSTNYSSDALSISGKWAQDDSVDTVHITNSSTVKSSHMTQQRSGSKEQHIVGEQLKQQYVKSKPQYMVVKQQQEQQKSNVKVKQQSVIYTHKQA